MKLTRIFSPAATRSRSGVASRGETANTGIVHVPRLRPTIGQPDAAARPSNSTATQPVVVSGVGCFDTRHTAPGAASIDSRPSPFDDGAPELGHVVFSTVGVAPARCPPAARISHDTG